MTNRGSRTPAILLIVFFAAPAALLSEEQREAGSIRSATAVVFSIPAYVEAYGPSTLLTPGDVNGDGKDDLIWRNERNQLVTYLAVGEGRFSPVGEILPSHPVGEIAFVDFNADGFFDVAYHAASGIGVLEGKGDGTFKDLGIQIEGPGPELGMIVGDFDGDGCREVARVDNRSIQFENRTVPLPIPIVNAGTFARGGYQLRIATADFDGDRADDLVISLSEDLIVPPYELHWLIVFASVPGKGFSLVSKLRRDHHNKIIRAADYDRDGRMDLIMSLNREITLNRGNGDGTFSTTAAVLVDSTAKDFKAGDLDDNGTMDLAVILIGPTGDIHPPQTGPSELVFLHGNGAGELSQAKEKQLHSERFALLTERGRVRYVAVANWETQSIDIIRTSRSDQKRSRVRARRPHSRQ